MEAAQPGLGVRCLGPGWAVRVGQQLRGCDAQSGGKKELSDGASNLVLKGGGS